MSLEDIARRRLVAEMALVGAQDAAAFRRLYDMTSKKLFGVCFRILNDRGAAEDVLQDVYVTIWKHAGKFDSRRASPITWLCTIARNQAIDSRRASQRSVDRALDIHPIITPATIPAFDAMLIAEESRRDAMACLDRLSEDQRNAIRDAFLEGLTYQELAERRSVPLGTMKSWIRRGLLEMRKCLSND